MGAYVGMSLVIGAGLLSDLGASVHPWWGGLAGPPRVWRARRHEPVRWIGGRAPDAEEETALAWEAIVQRGLGTYGEVARYVADRLFREDVAGGAWVADVGLLRPWYLLHACESLDRQEGRLLRIGDGAPPCSR